MYRAIREIQAEFQKAGLKCGVNDVGGKSILQAGMTGEKSTYHFLFVKEDDQGNDVAIRILNLAKFPQSKFSQAYELLNKFQDTYRYVRFTLNDDGNVVVEYDFPTKFDPIGPAAVEMLLRLTKILDNCYPELMQAIWS